MPPRPRLTRSNDRWIAGVCAGIAEFLGWQPVAIRALWVFLSLFTYAFPGVIAYAVAWILIPARRGPFNLDDFRSQ